MTNKKFNGIPDATFDFLSELHENNSKDWFEANRHRYEEYWKLPAFDLIEAVANSMKSLTPPLKAEARINGSLRRINRDVRFSKDKSPYNARIHLVFWSGNHPNRSPGFHLVLHANKMGFGAGAFGFGAPELEIFRERITDPNDRSVLMKAIKQAKTAGCDFGETDLVNVPKGYSADGEWEHLLRRKAFVMQTIDDINLPKWIKTEQAVPEIMKLTQATAPFLSWLSRS